MRGTRGIWPGCCTWGRSSLSRYRAWKGKRPGIWCGPATRKDLMSARHRLSKLLLRHGIVYNGGRLWTRLHDQWLRSRRLPQPGTQLALETAYDAMLAALGRRDRLDEAVPAMAADSDYTPVVTRLGCLRGVSALTAFGLAVEVG